MTPDEIRALLGLGPEVSDAEVAAAYEAYLSAGQAQGDGSPVVTLQEVKDHLRIRHDDEDSTLAIYLAAALADLDGPEGWLGRALTERTYVKTFRAGALVRLPCPPIVSITTVETRGSDAIWSALPTDAWELDGRVLTPASGGTWSAGGAVRVTYRAGYDPSVDRPLPFNAKAAILLMVGDLYANRTTTEAPRSSTAERLLRPLQVFV